VDQHGDAALQVVFHTMESLANVLINVADLGLYSLAGLVLLPAVLATPGYPRWLAWLDAMEWGIATALLVFAPGWRPALDALRPVGVGALRTA
jgi:hypothetical protein